MEWLAALPWNQWQLWSGIRIAPLQAQNPVQYLDGQARNPMADVCNPVATTRWVRDHRACGALSESTRAGAIPAGSSHAQNAKVRSINQKLASVPIT
jgi:hypothetical protein